MDKYERLGVLGEGSYGVVTKCKHKETGHVVAIKKFIESEDDKVVKKVAHREIRMLKQLRHENLISLLEVFHRKRRLFLVFEFMDRTVLDDMERKPEGLNPGYVREIVWQVLKGVEFIHDHQIIHRDVKPENILISKHGIVKLCDFGFARAVAQPGEKYTDYVATRWYRGPELLVGDPNYGKAVDTWAIGCLFPEMLTGEPLFPGNSDIDQIYLIRKCFGNLPLRFREVLRRNENFIGVRHPEPRELEPIERRFPHLSPLVKDIIKLCLKLEPNDRKSCSELLQCPYFTHDGFDLNFTIELRAKIKHDIEENPLIRSLGVTIHGSAHDYEVAQQQQQVATSVQGLDPAVQASLADIIDGTMDSVRRDEKKKIAIKKKFTKVKKVGDGKIQPSGMGPSAASVMRRPKEPPTSLMKPPEMDSRHKKNSFPQTADPSYLKGPATLSQTNMLNGRRSGITTPLGGPHPQYTVTSPTPHVYAAQNGQTARPPSKKISMSSNIDLISQPMHHNLRQPSSNSSASGSSSSQFPPGQVGSVTSITGSGISSAENSDILPEKNAQNRLRQSAKGHPLITDVLFATQGSSPSNQQRAMPTLRKPGNPLQLPTLPKEQEKSKLSPTSNQKSTLVGFVSTLGQNSSSNGTSPGSTGVGKSLLLGAMGGPSAYLSSLPGKVQICIAAMASEQDSPNVGENDFLRVSDSLSADSSSFNIDEPQPLLEPESQIAGFLQPLDDVEHRGQRNIIKEHLPVPFGTGSISPKEFQLATINPSGKDLPKDTTISPVEENPEHLLVPPITTAEAQLTFSKQNQGNDVQNPSDDTRKPSSRDQQSLSGKVSTLQPQSDYVDELKKSASRELEKTPATEEITRKKMEEIKSLVKQLYVKVNEPDARRFTSLERSVEDRFRTVHDYMGIIAQQMEVLNKVTGLSPDSSVEEAWKALLSQSVDRFEPGMFFEVNPCIISYECSTRPNGKALVYVRESFKGLLERIISVHNAHRAQSTTSDHDSTTNATQDRMESNTATGSTTATDQTNPVVTATERHTDESPASTTTAITTPITGNTDELTPITGNAIEPTPITGDPDEPTPNTGLGNKYLVTGTPGTGKSCFAYYLLHHLLAKEGDSVLYQNCHNNMKYFVVITRLEGNNFDVASYQMPNNGIPKPSHGFLGKGEDSVSKVKPVSWYIFDSGHKSGAKPESTDVPTIVISSPDCDQYKDFMLKGPEKFYMPTWEWEEIDALVRQLHPDKSAEMDGSIQRAREDCRQEENNNEKKKERIAEAFQTFSELARASEAFIRHGGVIRDVLNTDSEDRLLKSLHKAVDRSNVEMVLQFLQARGDVSSAVSYRILHQKCDKRLENGRLDYQNPSIHFASKYVHDRFWDKHRQKKADLTIEQLSLMYELMPPD